MWDFAAAIRCICLPLGIPSEHRSGIWHKRDAFWKPWIFWTNWKQSGGLAPLSAAMGCGPLRRGIAVVISDFMTDRGIEDTVKLLQQKKQEVLLVQVLSKEEEEPKVGGAVRLVDAETGESRDLELNEAMAAAL